MTAKKKDRQLLASFLVGDILLWVKHEPAVLRGEIFEFRVCFGDQGKFFCSGPTLDLFFS
jgi:hypothetical protein